VRTVQNVSKWCIVVARSEPQTPAGAVVLSTQFQKTTDRVLGRHRGRDPVAIHLGDVVEANGPLTGANKRVLISIVFVVRPRDGNVAGITPDTDVCDVGVAGKSVQVGCGS
jgi:hypothetical protein